VLVIALCQYWLLMSLHDGQKRRTVTRFSGESFLLGSVHALGEGSYEVPT
jgi:hypothetical protein